MTKPDPFIFFMKRAIVLLSGGIDSSTTLYLVQRKGYKPTCLIFDYHQRHRREIESAKKIAQSIRADYKLIKISLPEGESSLLNPNIPLKSEKKKIPLTYVPARNIIFLSYAVSYAESSGTSAIFIGANQIDYSGYPDCRETFISAFNEVIKEGTRRKNIKVIAPLIEMTKGEIIKLGMKLKVPYHLTWSCYAGGEKPCLKCDSCKFRLKGFKEMGIKDPILDAKSKNF